MLGDRYLTVLVAVVLSGAIAGCGMGQRSREADRLHTAAEKVIEAKTVHAPMTVTVAIDPELANGDVASALAAAAGTKTEMQAVADIEFPRKRAIVSLPNGIPAPRANLQGEAASLGASAPPAEPPAEALGVVFAGAITFVKRPSAAERDQARSWFAYDYREVDENDARLSASASAATMLATFSTAVHPIYLVELLGGVLPGSIELDGADPHDAAVTRYRANVSLEKARDSSLLGLDDDAKELRRRAFALIGVRDDIVPIEVAVAADGTARRMVVRMPSRPSRRIAHTVTVAIEFAELGVPRELTLPSRDESVRVDAYGPLVRALSPET